MKKFFSHIRGFLIEGVNIPKDYKPEVGEIPVSEEQYKEFSGVSPQGKLISVENDALCWMDVVLELSEAELADNARHERNLLVEKVTREINRLEDRLKDASLWRLYRVELRDLPSQNGFPNNIIWPTQPEEFTGA